MRTLAIIGASGHGKVVADAALSSGWQKIIFFDDRWPTLNKVGPWDVIGNCSSLLQKTSAYDEIIVAIGANAIRMEKITEILNCNIPLATIIHPSSIISSYTQIGIGSVIFAGAILNIDSSIGIGSIVNTGATIDHDCKLGNGVHISPGANLAGGVHIGDLSWIGIGTAIRQNINIGTCVTVGAGSVVVQDIANDCIVAGVPARPLHKDKVKTKPAGCETNGVM